MGWAMEFRRPYQPFFLLAALDAVIGIAVWLPGSFMAGPTWWAGLSARDWHRDSLLFATMPAILAGFLLTALPRWTGRAGPSPALTGALAGLWACARAALLLSRPVGIGVAAVFLVSVSAFASVQVIAARDRRNLKVLVLLSLFAAGVALAAAGAPAAWSYRPALASLLGLVMVIGGRVTPALTIAFAERQGRRLALSPSAAVERTAAAAAGCALALWIAMPEAPATGAFCILAAAAQAVRLLRWRGWRCLASASVAALHLGYGWIAIGFGLLATHVFAPAALGPMAAIHAWTVGAIGTMCLAAMASMVRRHSGQAFAEPAAAKAMFVSITASSVARLTAELFPGGAAYWTGLAALCWIAAFGLFLFTFHHELLRVGAGPSPAVG